MQPIDNRLSQEARAYFLEQGKSIGKLSDILNSNVFIHHLQKWLSLIIEIILYSLFIVLLIVIALIPMNPRSYIKITDQSSLGIDYHHEDLAMAMLLFSCLLILSTLPVLFFAILLGRNRRKNALIRQAFTEVKKMKEKFDIAVRELKL